MSGLTAEEFIREKIRAKFELKGEMNGLWTYGLNGEDALRWAHEYAEMKANGATTGEKQCNLPVVMRCACCGNTTKFSDGAKQQILIEEEYRYIYAVTCDECGKVCDVELFD